MGEYEDSMAPKTFYKLEDVQMWTLWNIFLVGKFNFIIRVINFSSNSGENCNFPLITDE